MFCAQTSEWCRAASRFLKLDELAVVIYAAGVLASSGEPPKLVHVKTALGSAAAGTIKRLQTRALLPKGTVDPRGILAMIEMGIEPEMPVKEETPKEALTVVETLYDTLAAQGVKLPKNWFPRQISDAVALIRVYSLEDVQAFLEHAFQTPTGRKWDAPQCVSVDGMGRRMLGWQVRHGKSVQASRKEAHAKAFQQAAAS